MWIWIVFALAAGLCATFQSAINGNLSRTVGLPLAIQTNTVVYVLASLIYLVVCLVRGPLEFGKFKQVGAADLVGGFFGFGVVFFLTVCFPRIGALWTVALMILGQTVSALVVDHFGWFGLPVASVSLQRVTAIGLILSGIFLLKR